jgi:hypothetical protein
MPDNNVSELPKKVLKRLSPEFIDAVSALDTNEIKTRILECEGHLAQIEKTRAEDEELLKAKEHAKELSAPYKDNRAEESAKIAYCIYVLEGRGVSLARE